MRIVVAYKWAADPQEAVVTADGQIDYSRAKPAISDEDAVAIAVGRLVADTTGAALTGLSVGAEPAGSSLATKAALARGLDDVFVIADPVLGEAGSIRTAQALAAAVREFGDVSLVVCGDASVDVSARMVPSVLAGLLGWPVVSGVKSLTLGPPVSLERIVPEGVQTLQVDGPLVAAMSADAVKVSPPGMKDVMGAGKKPVRVVTAADLSLELADEGIVSARAKLSGPARRQIIIDTADPVAAAANLVAALRNDGDLEA